jgi:hypothetical protein
MASTCPTRCVSQAGGVANHNGDDLTNQLNHEFDIMPDPVFQFDPERANYRQKEWWLLRTGMSAEEINRLSAADRWAEYTRRVGYLLIQHLIPLLDHDLITPEFVLEHVPRSAPANRKMAGFLQRKVEELAHGSSDSAPSTSPSAHAPAAVPPTGTPPTTPIATTDGGRGAGPASATPGNADDRATKPAKKGKDRNH